MNLRLAIILLIILAFFSQVIAPAARGRQQGPAPAALAQQRSKALAVYKAPPQAPAQRPNAYGQRQRDDLPKKGTNRPRFGQEANPPRKGPSHYAPVPAAQRPNALTVYKRPPQAPIQRPSLYGQRQRDALPRKGTNRPNAGGANLPRKGPAQAPRPMPPPAARPAPRPAPRPTPKKPVTNALVPRPNFALTKAVPTAKKPVNDPREVPMELRKHQLVTCKTGRAVYDLYWTEPYVGFRKYHVSCLNFTTSCREKCEYTTKCTQNKYGPNLYVRGIWVIYDSINNFQHYLLFLCCNTTLAPENRRCEGKPRLKESTQLSSAVVEMTQLSFREAQSTYPDDKNKFSMMKGGQKIYFEACTNIKQKKSVQLCPYVQVGPGQSGSGSGSGTSSGPPLDPLLAAGITSLVLGTVMVALVVCRCDCCCRANEICAGKVWYKSPSGGEFVPATLQECLARCLADVRCAAMEYHPGICTCDINYASDLRYETTNPSVKYCYKCE